MRSLATIAFFLFLFTSCLPESEGPYDDSRAIKDVYGRTLILHGLNTASNAKYSDDHMPNLTEADVDKEVQWGFNVVRLLTMWEAIEPDSGVYDYDYIDDFEERVNWYTDRGMYVLIDMHQDVYSHLWGGNGHPDWTVFTNGLPIPDEPFPIWWLNGVWPAAEAAHRNFWEYSTYAWLQDRYMLMWQEMVDRFKDNPLVIGYDIMNEPHSGNLEKTFNTQFEKHQLSAFYDRAISAIRDIDPEKYIFFEPQSFSVNQGLPSSVRRLNDPRPGDRKLVYSPHCYLLFAEADGGVYDQSGNDQLRLWEYNRNEELNRHQSPMLVGEWAMRHQIENIYAFVNDWHDMADRMQSSWAYWSNDKNGPQSPTLPDGSETPLLNLLIRTYPQATAGRLLDFMYDPGTREFEMQYVSKTSISMPTEIFIPQRHYEGGWSFSVEGTDNWSHAWDPVRQILSVFISEDQVETTVKVFPN